MFLLMSLLNLNALIIKTQPIPVVMDATGISVTKIHAVNLTTMTSLPTNAALAVVFQLITALSTKILPIPVAMDVIGISATRAHAVFTMTKTSLPSTAAPANTHHLDSSTILQRMTLTTMQRMILQLRKSQRRNMDGMKKTILMKL